MEEAAEQCGIPLSEVHRYIEGRVEQLDTLNFELRVMGQGALKRAVKKLTQLAKGDAREGMNFESTDLEAAKALAKIGMDALKLSKSGVAKGSDGDGQNDLFDAASPWTFKKVE